MAALSTINWPERRRDKMQKLLTGNNGREDCRYDFISSEDSDTEPTREPRIFQGRMVRKRICRRLRNQSSRLTRYKKELDEFSFGGLRLEEKDWPYRYSERCSTRAIPDYAPVWTKKEGIMFRHTGVNHSFMM